MSKHNNYFPTKHVDPCYKTHKPLLLGGQKVYGSSCSHPNVSDANIYVALDEYSYSKFQSFPWEPDNGVLDLSFPIPDMRVPSNPDQFKAMVTWLCNQLQTGKRIHVGCIGGHGRTGMVLAAMAAQLGDMDAITYVRQNYCEKAVETSEQVDFLVQHYGVKKVKGTRVFSGKSSGKQYGFDYMAGVDYTAGVPKATSYETIPPLPNCPKSIWKSRAA